LTIKARHSWSDASFNDLLHVLGDILPKQNKVPANMYYAKKLVSPLMICVEKIHACRNYCILYRDDQYKDLDSCPNCGASRYKTNKDYRKKRIQPLFLQGGSEEDPNEDSIRQMFKAHWRKWTIMR